MTHPLSRHWDQPKSVEILLDDTHALMSKKTFLSLHEYSCSNPSGVYDGKMWRRYDGRFDQRCGSPIFLRIDPRPMPVWMLRWYGPSADPDKCSVNSRIVILSDAPLEEFEC